MKEVIEKYIASMYYIFKESIHSHFACTCDILKIPSEEYGYSNGKCTCLTSQEVEKLVCKIFEPFSLDGNNLMAIKKCGAIYQLPNIISADLLFGRILELADENYFQTNGKCVDYFSNIKFKLDIICCYAALTNNDSDNNIDIIIKILFGNYDDLIASMFNLPNGVYIETIISDIDSVPRKMIDDGLKNNVEILKKILKDIFTCWSIAKTIITNSNDNIVYANFIDFTPELFKYYQTNFITIETNMTNFFDSHEFNIERAKNKKKSEKLTS